MSAFLILFGIITSSLVSVLVGLLGARRKIGFGWSYLISVVTTPLIGLIVTLLFDKLPDGERKWGCLGILLAIVAIVLLIMLGLAVAAAYENGDMGSERKAVATLVSSTDCNKNLFISIKHPTFALTNYTIWL